MDIKTKLRVALQAMVKHRGQILGAIGISILLVMVIAVVEVMASYSRYAAIIDARLADRSLLYPAGIYAAPCRVSLGERITRDDLVERLLRAGYQESEQSNEFTAGSFTLQPDSVEFRTNEFAVSPGLPALARVSFDRDRVRQIEDGHTDQQCRPGWAPNRHSMRSRLDVAIARRNLALDAMADAGRISAAEAASAKGEQLVLLPPQRLDDTAAPHFVDYLMREFSRHLLEEEVWPRLRIETTLDPDLQQAANQAVTRHLNHC